MYTHSIDGGLRRTPHLYYTCDCGGETVADFAQVQSGHTTSCGCSPIGGQNALDVPYGTYKYNIFLISPAPKNSRGELRSYCRCPKCDNVFMAKNTKLLRGLVKSCGNCDLMRNKVRTSKQALDIDDIIQTKYNTQHNYNTEARVKRKINVDIAIIEHKIAIEYDSFYFHRLKRDQTQTEKIRTQKLLSAGWKLLTIRGDSDIPEPETILSNIAKLIDTEETYIIVTMDDWVVAENLMEVAV